MKPLPCPFCGSTQTTLTNASGASRQVLCPDCCARGPSVPEAGPRPDAMYIADRTAALRWNMAWRDARAEAQSLAELVALSMWNIVSAFPRGGRGSLKVSEVVRLLDVPGRVRQVVAAVAERSGWRLPPGLPDGHCDCGSGLPTFEGLCLKCPDERRALARGVHRG